MIIIQHKNTWDLVNKINLLVSQCCILRNGPGLDGFPPEFWKLPLMKENYTVSIAKLSLEIDLKIGRLATTVVSRYPSVQSVSDLFIIKYFDQTETGSYKNGHVLALEKITKRSCYKTIHRRKNIRLDCPK
eukprot:TCONS_00031854-protein